VGECRGRATGGGVLQKKQSREGPRDRSAPGVFGARAGGGAADAGVGRGGAARCGDGAGAWAAQAGGARTAGRRAAPRAGARTERARAADRGQETVTAPVALAVLDRCVEHGATLELVQRGEALDVVVDGRRVMRSDARRAEKELVELALAPL